MIRLIRDPVRWQLATRLRTLGHLRGSQLWWRARYTLERRRPLGPGELRRWQWSAERAPRLRADFPCVPAVEGEPVADEQFVRQLAAGVLEHLNDERELGPPGKIDWQLGNRASARLWTVTLHYHRWAYQLARIAAAGGVVSAEAARLLTIYLCDWLEHCGLAAPGARPLAWNAYAIATRLSWWTRTVLLLDAHACEGWPQLRPGLLASLWQQAAYLADHLEWDLRGNHLLRDAVGLAWAGRLFDEPEAHGWLAAATELGIEQAREQVLDDGGHFERSPMYHLHAMQDVLALALLVEDDAARAELVEDWRTMAEYAAWLRHPDGQIPLLNDAAVSDETDLELALACGRQLGVEVDPTRRRGGHHFIASGVVVWHGDPWSLFWDVGDIGPEYQPGHAHADTLSLECSFEGERLVVDPGTFGYDRDPRRAADRSTAAHNTVTIDGQDSSEVWHIFRVGRRARPLGVQVEIDPHALRATATHDGYDHLAGRPRQERHLRLCEHGSLDIVDRLNSRAPHRYAGGLLIHPSWQIAEASDGWLLSNGSRRVRVRVSGPAGLRLLIQPSNYHPEFGRELAASRLEWTLEAAGNVEVCTSLEGLPADRDS